MEENLVALGFSLSEARVYAHLLETGGDYPARISAATLVNRTNVYEALDRLVAKGLVSFILKNKVKWFEARSDDLSAFLAKKESEAKKNCEVLLSEVRAIVPKQRLEASVFAGKSGLRLLFEDMLRQKQPIALIASKLQLKKTLGPYFELWHMQRAKFRIRQRSIFPEALRDTLPKRRLLQYRFASRLNPTTTIIYGNKCVFIEWSAEPLAVKIESSSIAQSHQNYFDALWETLS